VHHRWPLLLGLLSFPFLLGFTPFTPVVNVCPKCPAPKTDLVALTSGLKIPCRIIAQTSDFYVIARHGELRAVEKTLVWQVKWRDAAAGASLASGDQILQKNGVVLHGTITDEQPGRFFIIQVGTAKHVVWMSQIQSVHKAGKPYTPGA
jgi:hypothetical protein